MLSRFAQVFASRVRLAPASVSVPRRASSSSPLSADFEQDYLDPAAFHDLLTREHGVEFFAGVPDSLLKNYCSYVMDTVAPSNHLIAANEGGALASAAGHYLATGHTPLVYLQNSGLGNIINPLLSLSTRHVYSLPALLLIGWRGEPGRRDEPQHNHQGKLMPGMLASMEIASATLPDYYDGAADVLKDAFSYMRRNGEPFALMVKKQTFAPYTQQKEQESQYSLTREDAYRVLLPLLDPFDAVVSTTGFASREVYEIRDEGFKPGEGDHSRDFLTVGSMGHASALALGIAMAKPSRTIVCLDGDGAMGMHMGNSMAIGLRKPNNFLHVLINNGVHDSVGSQPTGAYGLDFEKIALGLGYSVYARAEDAEGIKHAYAECKTKKGRGPAFLEIRTKPGARADLGRPKTSPAKNRSDYMDFLRA